MMATGLVRGLAMLGLCASLAIPAAAQDFVNEGGPIAGSPVLIRVGDTSSTVVKQPAWVYGTRVFGSRYTLFAGFDQASQTERLYFFDLRTGAEGLVPGVVLEGTAAQNYFAASPRIVADDLHNRVFIWHGRRVSVLDGATLQLTDLLTADSHRTLPGGLVVDVERLIAFAPESNVLFLIRNQPGSNDLFETAVIDAATGAVVRTIAAAGDRISVNRTGTRVLLSSYRFDLQLLDVGSGAVLQVPYPPDIESWPFSEDLPGPPALDEAHGRIIVPVQRGFHALDLQLSVVASIAVPNFTTGVLVSRATGRTFLRWTGPRRSGYPLPGPCFQAVFRADDSLARVEDLSSVGATALQGCGNALLSVPAKPPALQATVVGRRVTFAWVHPGDTSSFELEAGFAPGRTDLRIALGSNTGAEFDGVPAGTYYVRVRGVNELGPGIVSDAITVVVQ